MASLESYLVDLLARGRAFRFAVGGTFDDFRQGTPRSSGVCVNSYLFLEPS